MDYSDKSENYSDDNSSSFAPNASGPNEVRLLKRCFDRIMDDFKMKQDPFNESKVEPSSLSFVAIKKKLNQYVDLDDFLADIKRLGSEYKTKFSKDIVKMRIIKGIAKRCRRDVDSIRKCEECFEFWLNDPDNYFKEVCSKPHLLVYAKFGSYPYWPAKLMSIDTDDDTVNVEFFDDIHSQADIPADRIVLYSEKLPGNQTKSKELKSGLKELDQHVKRIVQKFGSFIPADYMVQLCPDAMENQLKSMIPGAFDTLKENTQSNTDEMLSNFDQPIDLSIDEPATDSDAPSSTGQSDELANGDSLFTSNVLYDGINVAVYEDVEVTAEMGFDMPSLDISDDEFILLEDDSSSLKRQASDDTLEVEDKIETVPIKKVFIGPASVMKQRKGIITG